MEEAEKVSLSTSLPELIKQIRVDTRLKAGLYSSALIKEEKLDSLIEKNNGQNFVFQFVQHLKRVNEPRTFSRFQTVLSDTGQQEAARVLQTELIKNTHSLRHAAQLRSATKPKAANCLVVQPEQPTDNTGYPQPSSQVERLGLQKKLNDKEVVDLKKSLRPVLPSKGVGRQCGDVVVPNDYYRSVHDFLSEQGQPAPGPIPKIDTSKVFYDRSEFRYLPPACCAVLNRTYGTRALLTTHKKGGHSVLQKIDSTVVYCRATITLEPGSLYKRTIWISTSCSLREGISTLVSWPELEGRIPGTKEPLDLSISAELWYPRSETMGFTVVRKGVPGREMSISEKRSLLDRCLKVAKEGEVKCPVDEDYGDKVKEFASGESEDEPGTLQAPSEKAPAHNIENVMFLPVECCATLIEMYGGTTTMIRGSEQGCSTLDDMDVRTLFVVTQIYIHSDAEFDSDNPFGAYYFNVRSPLREAIAVAIGWYPSRAQTYNEPLDLDLQMTVREWFDVAESTGILLWDE